MEIVYEIERQNIQKVRDIILGDDIVGRASVIFKDGNSIGLNNNYYCYISGVEEACKRSEEIIKNFGKKIDKKISENIIKKIKEDEEKAIEGFGGIFG